jgi:hypothetical protein
VIAARWEWNPIFGWHETPCLGPGPFERAVQRMQREARIQRLKAMVALVEVQEMARAA